MENFMIDPKCCPHEQFHADVKIARITDLEPIAFSADVTIRCVQCDTPFTFIGMPLGFSHDKPMMSIDREEARLPIKPRDQLEHGRGAGFSVQVRK